MEIRLSCRKNKKGIAKKCTRIWFMRLWRRRIRNMKEFKICI
jgi:hypothetical protein